MPRSEVVTVAELLGRNADAAPHAPLAARDMRERTPWLTRRNKTSAAITFGSVLAVGTTLALGSTLLPHRQVADEVAPTGTPGPVTDTTTLNSDGPLPEHTPQTPSELNAQLDKQSGPAGTPDLIGRSGLTPAPADPLPSGRAPAERHTAGDPRPGTARAAVPASPRSRTQAYPQVPAQRSAPRSTRSQDAVPGGRQPGQRSEQSPAGEAPTGSGRHRDDSDRRQSDIHRDGPAHPVRDRSRSDSGRGLDLGDTLRGLGAGLR